MSAKLTPEEMRKLASLPPEQLEGIVRRHPLFKETQEQLGMAEARIHYERQTSWVADNVNPDYGDILEAHSKHAVKVKSIGFSWLDDIVVQLGTVWNAHKHVHKRPKVPTWLILLLVFGGVPLIFILAYPPYAIGLGAGLAGTSGGVPNAFLVIGILALLIVFGWLFFIRRKNRPDR